MYRAEEAREDSFGWFDVAVVVTPPEGAVVGVFLLSKEDEGAPDCVVFLLFLLPFFEEVLELG